MKRRSAAVAGRFYPGDADTLEAQIDGYLEQAAEALDSPPSADAAPKAMIAPHAGTVYSGPVAATAYVRLAAARERIERVVLLGPSHRVYLNGLGASSAETWTTPLGDVPLDRASIDALLELPQVETNDEAHRQEHSLEVHLPFLQRSLSRFALVPLVVGQCAPEEVAEVLERSWGGPETAIVVSADLSHFHDYDTASALDRETSDMIEALELEKLTGERTCGCQPVRGLLHYARHHGMKIDTVDLRNSGDTAGPRREVVGYGSYLLC